MNRTLHFLLAKDPVTQRTGDMAMASLVMELASEAYTTRYICLSDRAGHRDGNELIEKPAVSAPSLLKRAVGERKSLVHARFTVPAMTRAIEQSDADAFIADHSYMAEPFLASTKRDADLRVNSVVSESYVWGSTHGVLGKVQKRAIENDQLRVARHARSLATYDATEAEEYRQQGIANARWLDVSLPPKPTHGHTAELTRLAFVGDRTWAPNQEGFELLLSWWPRIAAGIPGAELAIIGKAGKPVALPDGVRDLGFVDDLDAALNSCRGILAPIQTGGGVRVKILDAAALGIPLVATGMAIGSLESMFNLTARDSADDFIEAARRLLLDREVSLREGVELYAQNRDRWTGRLPHAAVEGWLA